jgi:hypothetical protein
MRHGKPLKISERATDRGRVVINQPEQEAADRVRAACR